MGKMERGESPEWIVFVVAEPWLFARLFRSAEIRRAHASLESAVAEILAAEPKILGLYREP
ncbi:MAG TPA: hypothetical protein VKS60_02615 [Stellaceae bacterium]|nr:hypothetical protein [Stellaceae bacterium]